MDLRIDRRQFAGAALGGASALLVPRFVLAETPPLTAVKLRSKLTLIAGAGANIVAAAGTEGMLLVDGGLSERSADVLDFLAALATNRVEVLFNTNWRPEHTGLNDAVQATGTRIIAHENTKLWMGNDFTVPWQNRVHKARPAAALPNETFYTRGQLDFGDERVEYGYLAQAHTDGDIYVFFPNSNVLVASDLLSVGTYPIVDYVTGGWLGGMAEASRALLALADSDTLVIPASGSVCGRAELEAQLEFCSAMKDTVGGMIKNGRSLEEVIAAEPTKPFVATFGGDAELFLALAYKGLWGHIRELGGVL